MRKRYYFLLLLFPVAYFLTGIYFHQVNGLYSVRGTDPEYIYFINGLTIANGKMEIGNIDHPGIPFDYLLAASFRITHLFRDHSVPFNRDVLSNADLYLKMANLMFIFLTVLVLLFAGYATLKITQNVWYALIVQFSPYATEMVYGNIGRLPTESLIVLPVILLTIAILKTAQENQYPTSRNHVLLLAACSTFALSLKLTIAPLLIIPFFLVKPLKTKFLYALLVVVFFLLFAWPVTIQLDYFTGWVKSLFLHSGQYGEGEKNIIEISSFWPNMLSLYRVNYLFFRFTAVAAAIWILTLLFNKQRKQQRDWHVIMGTTLAAILLLCLAVGKHFKTTYFVPALMLLPLLLILTLRFLQLWLPKWAIKSVTPLLILLAIFLHFKSHIPVVRGLTLHYAWENEQKMKAYDFFRIIEPSALKIVIPGDYGAPIPEYALMTSYQWAGKQKTLFLPFLADLYPHSYFFYAWDKSLNFWGDSLHIDGSVPAYVYFSKENQKEEFAPSFAEIIPDSLEWKMVFVNRETGESVYRVGLPGSQEPPYGTN